MKAVVYHSRKTISVDEVAEPQILEPTDAIVKVTSTAICGSDLHLYGGFVPGMEDGDIMGHEFMGIVTELGSDVTHIKVGDRVVVPFVIACGKCYFCQRKMFSLCDTTNPNKKLPEGLFGQSPAGLFGFSHMFGGYCGGQAEFARVPHADVGLFKVPDQLTDEQVLFLTDIFPTGYMAAENCAIEADDTVAIWGAGPVGQFAAQSAKLLGAKQILMIDLVPERLEMAVRNTGVIPINTSETKDVVQALKDLTEGRGPDKCIDAVGLESHASGLTGVYDRAKQAVKLETDRPTALREVIQACRKGGTVSIPGVYGGFVDKFPLGAVFNKGLTVKSGQTHVQKYVPELLDLIAQGNIDPSFVVTHRVPLEAAPEAYEMFRDKKDKCIKVVMQP